MKLPSSSAVNRTIIAAATTLALALPGVGAAGPFGKVRDGVQTVKTRSHIEITNLRQNRPVLNALQETRDNLPGADLIAMVQGLHLKEQLRDAVGLLQQMQQDYQFFSGGSTGCAAQCASFRADLKDLFGEFLAVVYELPALRAEGGLADNLERLSALVDYVPPRALYLMWQNLAGQIADVRTMLGELRQELASLPPLQPVAGADAMSARSVGTGGSGAGSCDWVLDDDRKPWVDLLQARLEMFAWRLKSAADLIPDVEVKAEGGAEAGAAVANATGAAGVGIKPADSLKLGLKAVAYVPERINWAIKINILRAKAVCR
jgi:hypothetical protein